MNRADLVPLVRSTVINAALAFEQHRGRGDLWRRVFKRAISDLPVKSGIHYRFLVRMSEQPRDMMEGVVRILNREAL